jgi:hypothetical protein
MPGRSLDRVSKAKTVNEDAAISSETDSRKHGVMIQAERAGNGTNAVTDEQMLPDQG